MPLRKRIELIAKEVYGADGVTYTAEAEAKAKRMEADPELASTRVRELVDDMVNYTANMDVQVLQGNKVVEVRSGGINKGAAAKMFLPKDAAGTFVPESLPPRIARTPMT